jgi:hypothetical protein
MKQETLTQPKNDLNNISFQQKSTILSLIITGGATVYYVVNMWPMRPIALASDSIPAGFGSLVLTTIGLIIVAQIIMQAVLAFGSGSTPEATAHERLAALKATRIANGVMTIGIMAAVASIFFSELTAFCTANFAFLGLAFGTMFEYAAQLFYARK